MKTHQIFKTLILFSALYLFGSSVFAKTAIDYRNHKIKHYNISNGLSNNNILNITQDSYGFMWIATTEGVNKFDGEKFTQYKAGKENISLSNNYAQHLLPSPNGDIWIATSHGLNIYDYSSDSICLLKNTHKKNSISSDDIICFSSHRNEGIWIGTYDNGIDYFNQADKSIRHLHLPVRRPSQYTTYVYEDRNQNLWIGTLSDGLYCYSLQRKTVQHYNTPRVAHIYQDTKGNVWISASNLYRYDPKKNKVDKIIFSDRTIASKVSCVEEDKKGYLWIASDELVGYFDLDSYQIDQPIEIQEIKLQDESWGLSFQSANCIKVDNENNIWIGTYGDGLYMVHSEQSKFALYTHNEQNQNSISGNKIITITKGRSEYFYIGINGSGIDQLDRNFKKVANYSHKKNDNSSLSSNFINCSFYDSQNNLWVGTSKDGLNKKAPGSSSFIRFQSEETDRSLPSNEIRTITEGKDGAIWIGTGQGLSRYQGNYFDNTFNKKIGKRIDIRSILQTDNQTLWIGTYGDGLMSYNTHTHQIKNYYNYADITQNYIFKLKQRGDSLCITTQGGGIRIFSLKLKKDLKVYNQYNGLNSDYIQTLEIDKQGNLWVASNKGISCIDKNNIRHFDYKDGVQENEFSSSLRFLDTDGREIFAFAGNGGLNIFKPSDLPKYKESNKVLFTSLKIFNQTVRPFININNGNPLKKHIINTQKIELNHSQSFFTIGFISLDYSNTKKMQYSYKLDGIDRQWNDIGLQQEITFRNLPAGKYILKVKAANSDGKWNATSSDISIIIHPPFWATGWAYFVYSLFLLFLLLILWNFSTMKIRAQNKLSLEKSERIKEEEIHQAKLQFFTNISHELRTPLTLIIGPLETLVNKPQNQHISQELNMIIRNAEKLLRLVNQLLDFRKTERGEMKLKVQYSNLTHYLHQIISSFDGLKQEKQIELSTTSSPLNLQGWYDRDFLDKILFNLLSNAYKYTPNHGQIKVETQKIEKENKQWVRISVSDTGCGIHKDEINLIFNRFYQSSNQDTHWQGTGIGLHLVSNLVELHHGIIFADSILGKGATFTIEIPIEKEAYSENEIITLKNTEDKSDESLRISQPPKTNWSNELPCILVVDDEEDIRTYVKNILSTDYNILEASNGEEAIHILEKEDCDIIISDIMMPKMDGITLCKTLKNNIETSHIPIVLLTAKTSIENRIEGLEMGADSYIPKPFHPKHLQIRVEKLIESRRLFKEKFSKNLTFQPQKIENLSIDDLLLQKIVNYIIAHISDSEINGDSIGKEVNMSRMNLHRKLKSLTGNSTSEFIRSVRLKQAAYLIENTQKNVSEICYEVGFNSPSYFATCFVNHFKVTPSDYLKDKREKANT